MWEYVPHTHAPDSSSSLALYSGSTVLIAVLKFTNMHTAYVPVYVYVRVCNQVWPFPSCYLPHHPSWCFQNFCISPLQNCLPHFGQTRLGSHRISNGWSCDVVWSILPASSLRWQSGMASWYCCCGWWGCTGRDGAGVGEYGSFRREERICKKINNNIYTMLRIHNTRIIHSVWKEWIVQLFVLYTHICLHLIHTYGT